MDLRTLGICIICSLSVAAVCHGEESGATNNTAPGAELGTTDLASTSTTVQTGTQVTGSKDQAPMALVAKQEDEKVREAAGPANAPEQKDSPSVNHEPSAQPEAPTSQEVDRGHEVEVETDPDCSGRAAGGQCDDPQKRDTAHETEGRLRTSDQGFLSSSRREKPMGTNYELALEHMLSSLLQFFPYQVVYVPIPPSRNADYRGRSSGGSKSASTDGAEGRSSAAEQAEPLSRDTESRTLPKAEKGVSPPDAAEGDAPRSRSGRPKKCKSCSPASYSENPYYDYYAAPYYAPYNFDYYGYDPYEFLGREGDYPYYYRSRNSQGGRYLGEFPDIHIGDTSLLHLRPARHQYEHRQYGSHYNHGMDRFFY